MKKTLLPLLSLAFLLVLAVPARADTDVSIFFGTPSVVHGYPSHSRGYSHERHRGRHHDWHHGWRHRPAYFSPVVVAPPRTVVYETTVIRPSRYVADSYLQAEPASPSYVDHYGRTCREYTSRATVAGSRGSVYGTACLQPDGAWRIVD